VLRGAVAIGVLVLGLTAGPAHAVPATSWSLYSEPGDPIGQGAQRVMHPGNVTEPIAGACCGSHDSPGARAKAADGESFRLDFSAPAGQPLAPYNRVGVQGHPFNEGAGMALQAGARSCADLFGRYELRELATDLAGRPTRLWLVYQAACEGEGPSFGEIRLNADVPAVQQLVAPGILRFPELDLWEESIQVPVAYRGTAVASVAVVGAHAADFPLDAAGCPPGAGPCEVRVRFDPVEGGARTATLRFTDATGRTHETTLEGYAHGGATEATITRGADPPVQYAPPATTFAATAWPTEVVASLGGATAVAFGSVQPPLAAGAFPNAVGTPGGPSPWLVVDEPDCGGGAFTVHELRRMPDETIRSFDVEFTCAPTVSGRWRFRAGIDPAALPAWLVPGPRAAPPDPPDPALDDDPFFDDFDDFDDEDFEDDEPARRRPRVRVRWRVGKRVTRVERMVMTRLPNRATVRIRCKGPLCPFRLRTVRARNGRADVGRRRETVRLWPGSVLELRAAGEVFRYTVRRGKPPRASRG
jgi:hypothetical protein